jgi:MoaA/NifB/PqqE/SkfB family radical SAM enzyme
MSAELLVGVDSMGISPNGELQSVPILILNVHENCNCRCAMCDIWKRPAGDELALEKVRSYQADIRSLSVRQVVLTGGEPLLHSRFRELCQILRECAVRITLLSSGLLLQKRAEVIADFVDELIVSLDGPEETHNRIRGIPRAYQLIRDGIADIRQHRPELTIHARSTVQSANFDQLRQTVVAAKLLGLNSISFLAVDTTSQAFNRELIWPQEYKQSIGLSSSQVSALKVEIELLIEQNAADIQRGFIAEGPDKLRRIARYFRSRLGEAPSISPLCNAPWVSAVIEVDGSLRPCFFHRTLAETRTQSLAEAINSREAVHFRQTLNVAEDHTCQGCVCSLNYRLRNT